MTKRHFVWGGAALRFAVPAGLRTAPLCRHMHYRGSRAGYLHSPTLGPNQHCLLAM
jgi:hypothetical protein